MLQLCEEEICTYYKYEGSSYPWEYALNTQKRRKPWRDRTV